MLQTWKLWFLFWIWKKFLLSVLFCQLILILLLFGLAHYSHSTIDENEIFLLYNLKKYKYISPKMTLTSHFDKLWQTRSWTLIFWLKCVSRFTKIFLHEVRVCSHSSILKSLRAFCPLCPRENSSLHCQARVQLPLSHRCDVNQLIARVTFYSFYSF